MRVRLTLPLRIDTAPLVLDHTTRLTQLPVVRDRKNDQVPTDVIRHQQKLTGRIDIQMTRRTAQRCPLPKRR
jgi:hypothetical protein